MRIALTAALAAGLVLLLQIMGSLRGGPVWWGVHHYAFVSAAWLAAGGLLAAALIAAFGWGRLPRLPAPLVAVLVAVAGAGLFWGGRQSVHFLGDGAFWIEGVRRGRLLWINEPGALFGVYYLNRLTGSPDPAVTFALVSVAAGVVALLCALWLSRLVVRDAWGRVLVFGLLTLSGLTRLFYGYAETYPVLAAAVLVYLALVVRRLTRDRGHPLLLSAAVTGAMALHVTAVLLVPSLAYVLWRGDRSGRRRRLAWLLVPVLALGAGGWILRSQVDPVATYSRYLGKFLPLAGDGVHFAYGLLSWTHLRDLVQEQLLLGPFGAPLALLLLAVARGRPGPVERFLLWAGIPWWGLSLVYTREIGAARDWDLFAAASIPFVLLSGVLLARALAAAGPRRRAVRLAAGCVLAVSLFHTLPWVALGRDAGRSLVHFAALFGPGSTVSSFARSYAWEEIGTFYTNRNDAENAVRAFRTAVRADSTNGRVAGILAGILAAGGRQEEAVSVLETAVRRTPYRAYLHFQLGSLYHERGETDRARGELTRALERNPDLVEASVALAVVERSAGRLGAAETVLRKAMERAPDDPALWLHLALVFQARGDSTAAMDGYRRALEGNPGDMTSAYNLGLLLLNANHPAEARAYFEQVVGVRPRDVEAWVNLGVCLDRIGLANAALTAFARARSAAPVRPEAYFHAVRIHLARRDTAQAVETLQGFLEHDATSRYGRAAEQLLNTLTGKDGPP